MTAHSSPFASVDRVVDESGLSGVVHVANTRGVLYERATGLADRAHGVQNTLLTQFAIASGTKGLTALALMSLIAEGLLALDADVRDVLPRAGGLVEHGVSVRHLLSHTSGMGDYLDEGNLADVEDYVLDVPVHRLAAPADFLPLLRGRPAKFAPGSEFAYCNSGYVLLALLIEAVSGRSYYEVVQERVCVPGGMTSTAFLRLDELPGSAALGYLPKRGWRTNHLHLPVRGGGDGGAYSTAADMLSLWTALFTGRIVPLATLAEMLRPQSRAEPRAYGLGFWLPNAGQQVCLEGCDPGISFRSTFDPARSLCSSVLSNTATGAWPVAKELAIALEPSRVT